MTELKITYYDGTSFKTPKLGMSAFTEGSWSDVKEIHHYDSSISTWKQVYPYKVPANLNFLLYQNAYPSGWVSGTNEQNRLIRSITWQGTWANHGDNVYTIENTNWGCNPAVQGTQTPDTHLDNKAGRGLSAPWNHSHTVTHGYERRATLGYPPFVKYPQIRVADSNTEGLPTNALVLMDGSTNIASHPDLQTGGSLEFISENSGRFLCFGHNTFNSIGGSISYSQTTDNLVCPDAWASPCRSGASGAFGSHKHTFLGHTHWLEIRPSYFHVHRLRVKQSLPYIPIGSIAISRDGVVPEGWELFNKNNYLVGTNTTAGLGDVGFHKVAGVAYRYNGTSWVTINGFNTHGASYGNATTIASFSDGYYRMDTNQHVHTHHSHSHGLTVSDDNYYHTRCKLVRFIGY